MPYDYAKKWKSKRRRRQIRRRAGRFPSYGPVYMQRRYPRVAIAPMAGTLGRTKLQKFRYVEQISLTAGVSTPATFTFRANGMFDPDARVGLGHQPIGFDQLMTFYNHYTVLGAKLKATFISQGPTASVNSAVVGIELSGNATPTTALNDIYEQGHSKVAVMSNGNAGQVKSVIHKLSVKKFLGQNPLDEDANAGTISSDPAELIYFHVFVAGTNSTVNPAVVDVLLELEQTALLHEPKPLAGS